MDVVVMLIIEDSPKFRGVRYLRLSIGSVERTEETFSPKKKSQIYKD
jgi:hypothetical protein